MIFLHQCLIICMFCIIIKKTLTKYFQNNFFHAPLIWRRFLAVLVLAALKPVTAAPCQPMTAALCQPMTAAAACMAAGDFNGRKIRRAAAGKFISCRLAPQGLVWSLLAPELVWPAARFSRLAPRDFLSVHRAICWRNLSRVECVGTA